MEKWSIEKMVDYWRLWEIHAGESFMDYFVDDNIHNVGIVLGYFCGKFPELGGYILEVSEYKIPWKFIMDSPYEDGEFLPSIDMLVEEYYEVEDEEGVFNKENYNKAIYVWCSLLHDIDIYYKRFTKWVEKNETPDIIEKLNEKWRNETKGNNC